MGVMHEKLVAAGAMSPKAEVYLIAIDVLRAHKGDIEAARAALVARLRSHVQADRLLEAAVEPFLRDCLRDLAGPSASELSGTGDQHATSQNMALGAVEAGAAEPAARAPAARPFFQPPPRSTGQVAATVRARMLCAEAVCALFDTLRVRDGRRIGDVYVREIPALCCDGQVEVILLKKVEAYARNAGDRRIRDLVPAAVFERMAAEARMEARHAD